MSEDARPRLAVVGAGRLGTAITAALPDAAGPFGRGFDGTSTRAAPFDAVLLCVPDREIPAAAAAIRPGPVVGHCSGATGLDALAPHEGFVLHPLMTVRGERAGELAGAGCTVAGTTHRATTAARSLAAALGMSAVGILEEDRAVYHAAATFAANFLVTVEASAERLLQHTGVPRAMLVPLVEAAVANWSALGPERALTGPIARGDEQTTTAQRAAIAAREPALLPLFDALAEQTRALAGNIEGAVR